MMPAELVIGLWDTSQAIADAAAAEKYRSLTLAWSRYGYQGEILEADSVEAILDAAISGGYRYCLIEPYGCVLAERWKLAEQRHADFFTALSAWVEENDFLVVGEIATAEDAWYGLVQGCLLVNLPVYQQLGCPRFGTASDARQPLPCPQIHTSDDRIVALLPTDDSQEQIPGLWGWNVVRAGLEARLPIMAFSDELRAHFLDLEATDPLRRAALSRYFGSGISQFAQARDKSDLSADQRALLDVITRQTANARNGVFLWNIESYADIEVPRDDFSPPVRSLYSVAAGFKPNRMLETHGFNADTRVVFFDYSQRALDVKRYVVEHWDGVDFPRFVQHLFQHFPHPDTFYQLWDDVTPENVDLQDIEYVWQRELSRWGGPEALRDHWQAYARLKHEYICGNLLTEPAPILSRIVNEPSAMIWWSNAFFTMYGNWFYSMDERKKAYDHWIEQLVQLNPQLYLFGSDFNNTNVNSIQAAEYWDAYCQSGGDVLKPCKLCRTELRM